MKLPRSVVDMAATARASGPNGPCTLRAVGGGAITPELRDEMLARCAAGQHVELELEVLAYEQRAGEPNRNYVRFRDGGLMAMGRSGVGTPFLRDHDQDSALARGGTVIASAAEKRGEGDYAIRQTVRLTAPWAVELALRGLMSTVSIGWDPSARASCSLCTLDYWRGCMHLAGRRYRGITDVNGQPAFAEDLAGPMVCERVYSDASLVETSAVNVPAVPEAHIESIRAALAHSGGAEPHEDYQMMNPKLLALLGLAATAGEPEVLTAVETRGKEAAADKAELAACKLELAAANVEVGAIRATQRKAAEEKLFSEAIASGRLAPGGGEDEKTLRELYAVAPERAAARLAARPEGSVTPIGTPRQAGPAPVDPQRTQVDGAVAASGADPSVVRSRLAASFPNATTAELEAMIARVVRPTGRA